MALELTDEQARILRAVRDGRMVTNEQGRWVILGEDTRPDRRAREAVFNGRCVDYTFVGPSRVTAYELTEKGAAALVAYEAHNGELEEAPDA